MKCIKLEDAGIDVCVTVQVKPIFMNKPTGELEDAFDRVETGRLLKYLGTLHEGPVAEKIVREFRQRQADDAGN